MVFGTLSLRSATPRDTLPIRIIDARPSVNVFSTSSIREPRVVLVLSGGGARGAAHIGVLRQLEKNNIKPAMVIGTSMGAIVGGLWCAGYTAHEMDSLFSTVSWGEQFSSGDDRERSRLFLDQKYEQDRAVVTLRFQDFSLVVPQSITGVMRFTAPFQRLFWNAPFHDNGNFDSLKIPFRAVATDIAHANVVALGRGNLVEAVRASATLPLRYAPVHIDSMVLVDGGLLANIPVEIAQQYQPDMIIAVNTTSPLLPTAALDKPWNVADQIVSVMEKQFNERATGRATVLIEPRIGSHLNTAFDRLDTLVAAGEHAAEAAMPTITMRIQELRDSLQRSTQQTAGQGVHDTSLIIRTVVVEGADTTLRKAIGQLRGRVWNAQLVRESILRICRRAEWTFAEIMSVRFDTAQGALTVRMDEGRLRGIEIRGNTTATRLFIARELNVKVGDRLYADEILHGLENIVNTDLFSEVSVDVRRAYPAREGVDMRVTVVERGSQVLRIGTRVDNERNTQFLVDGVQENIFSSGVRFGVRLGGGNRNSLADARIEIPRILDSYWLFALRGYWDSRNVFLYNLLAPSHASYLALSTGDAQQQRLGVRAMFGRQVETYGRISVEARYEAQRMFQLGDFVTNREFKPLGAVALALLIDEQDRADFPSKGRALSLKVERSILQAPDVQTFTKVEFTTTRTFQMGLQALKPALRLAFADAVTPQTEWFHLGGQDGMFGMREDERRSRNLLQANIEWRWKLPLRLLFDSYLSFRYDIGGVWPTIDAIRLADLYHGVGVMYSLDTPLGPARVALGRGFHFVNYPRAIATGPYILTFSIGMRIQ